MKRFSDEIRALRTRTEQDRLSPSELSASRSAILSRAEKKARPVLLRPSFAIAGAALLSIAALVVFTRPLPAPPAVEETPWFAAVDHAECVSAKGDALDTDAYCAAKEATIAVGPDRVTLARGTRIQRTKAGYRLGLGRAVFAIAHDETRRPLEIEVVVGTLIDRGTRFSVDQPMSIETGLRLEVFEGKVEFRPADGDPPRIVAAGETLLWPEPRGASPKPEPRAEAPRPRPPSKARAEAHKPTVKETMERLFQLESQHRDAEAERLLEEAAARPDFSAEQRARFDFELGKRLERAHGLDASACAHWKRHLLRFPDSPHAGEARKILAVCRTRKLSGG